MKHTWYRNTLLAGAAFAASAMPAKANDLGALKAQLEALQQKVTELERHAARPSLPKDGGWITYRSNKGTPTDGKARMDTDIPADSGFTIGITPSADLPVPLHEIIIGGYVKGDVIYDFDQDLGDYLSYSAILDIDKHDHVRLHARQSRLRIQSRSDTAVGQIRTLLEGDFFNGGTYGSNEFNLRHAWGEWDVTPNFTFGAGHYWRNFWSPFSGIQTVDFKGPAGLINRSRNAQVRLTYHDGPMELAFSAEKPTVDPNRNPNAPDPLKRLSDNVPDFAVRWQYDAPGGSQFLASAMTRTFNTESALGATEPSTVWGWGVQGAANINLADIAILSASVIYGDGLGNCLMGADRGATIKSTGEIDTIGGIGLFAGITMYVSPSTSVNFGWGYTKPDIADVRESLAYESAQAAINLGTYNKEVMSVHANVLWQPVSEMRLGWEVMWTERKFFQLQTGGDVAFREGENLRTQFGAWFFF